MSQSVIKFGTDGWRAIIADDFTFENVRTAAGAVAAYLFKQNLASQGACVGYDSRFASRAFAKACAQVLSKSGIPVYLADRITPTPALSWGVRELKAGGGIMITSSHNPAQWNGVKYKAWYGGSGSPSIISEIEALLGAPLPVAAMPAPIKNTDFLTTYLAAARAFVDLDMISKSGFKFAIDPMYGCGVGILAGILRPIGVECFEIHNSFDPLFPGINPEPILPNIRALGEATVEHGCNAGLCTDGDADRIGATDEHGNFVDPHKIFSVLLEWLLKYKGWPGDVTRAFNTTKMIDRICKKYGRTMHEHGIGFKYVCDYMLAGEVLIGGEESGGIGLQRWLPERDGILNNLMLANVMAQEGKSLGQLVAALQAEYGEHQYARIDLHIPEDLKQRAIARAKALKPGDTPFAGMAVLRVDTLDGVKFYLDNPEAKTKPNAAETWLLMRASGTEPLLRIYSESCSIESVHKLLDVARSFAMGS
jgi:phosphomannomutase